jgi:uncharacterized protein (TIGR03086 family)
MSADLLERAFQSTAKVLANIQQGQMDDPTPCKSWKVRDLVNHIVGGTFFFAGVAETGAAPEQPGDGTDSDLTKGDIQATFDEGAKRAVKAFRAPDAMDKHMKLPFGEMPGSAFVLIASTDTFTHGWDLAKATGQSTDLDPELAEQLLNIAQGFISPDFRGDEPLPFGPEVQAPASATKADQLAAFLGRTA